MTKNKVLVPDHIAAELENDKAAETQKEESNSEVDKAFVSAEERVLDPTLVDKTLIASDRLHPSGKMYKMWVDKMIPVMSKINYD